MKTAMLASLAFIAFAGAALAADSEPVVTPGPFSPPPAYPRTVTPGPFDPPPAYTMSKVYNWTGFYVGINGGGAFGQTKWFDSDTPDNFGGSSKISGGLAGGTAGYNLQAGDPFVVGFEADLDWAGITGTATLPTGSAACALPSGTQVGCELKAQWLGTARLRVGWAFDRILPYVTGGAVVPLLKTYAVGEPYGTNQTTNLSWTAGVGIEFAITEALRAKVEYLHVDLHGYSCNVACTSQSGIGPVSFNPSTEIIRAGLNYRLWLY